MATLEEAFGAVRDKLNNRVRVDAAQTLTDPQKDQARSNLGISRSQTTIVSVSGFPRLGGETDDMPRFRRALDVLATFGGGRLEVPQTATPYLFQFVPGSTITSSTRILITTNNIEILGIGKPVIEMKGLTTTYLFSIDDYASSGRDIFSAFSFAGVRGCKISNLRFVGEYTGDEVFRYQSPRSIAISFKGAVNCSAEDIEGENILGNVVNIVNSYIAYDAPFANSDNVSTSRIRSIHCLENGVNYMGGTLNCVANAIVSSGCANGLESATENFTLNGAVLIGNRSSGLALSGKNMIINGAIGSSNVRNVSGTPNPAVGFGLVITTGGQDIQVNGGKFNDNYSHAVYLYPGVKNIQLNTPEMRRNAKDATNKVVLQMVGLSTSRIQNVTLFGGEIEAEGSVTGTIANFTDNVRIFNVKGAFDTAASAMSFTADCNGTNVIGNQFNKPITMNDPTGAEYNNGSYRMVDRTSVPSTGTWVLGDIINNRSRSQGGIAEWNIIQSGTYGTLNGGSTTGSITSGTTALTVNSATGLYKGAYILIAGVTGVRRVMAVSGTTITIDVAADATVTGAAVSYRAPVAIASRQNGVKTAITAAPDYVGQLATVGGLGYMSTGTSSTADWKQITN